MNAMVPQNELTPLYRDHQLTAADIRHNVNLVQEVMRAVMKEGVHYGVIPGCKQPSLYKAGSEVLLSTFRIAVSVVVEDLSTPDTARYRVRAIGTHQTSGIVVGEGIGECSSGEEKYKWRKAASKAEFNAADENRRRVKYGRDWTADQVRTEPADLANTILKMAKKRAQIDMTLTATAASDCFSQDLEDIPEELREQAKPTPGRAAVERAQGEDSPERQKIVADLYSVADNGEAELLKAWQALTEQQRTAVGTEFGAIKKRAKEVGA